MRLAPFLLAVGLSLATCAAYAAPVSGPVALRPLTSSTVHPDVLQSANALVVLALKDKRVVVADAAPGLQAVGGTLIRVGRKAVVQLKLLDASGEVQTRHVERDITAVTVVAALCTYVTGLFWAQQYPDDVLFSPVPRASERSLTGPSGWALPLDTNPWLVGTITAPPTAAAPTSTPEP